MSEIVLTEFAERAFKRITPMYEDDEFIQEIFNGASFDNVREYFKTLRNQRFIESVDWGIEYQEHKYSLEPRPDLTLEQRRMRLGIRAQIHRPLNPARLEMAIKDNFGLDVYLYEKDPGYIWLCANYMTEESFKNTVEFLSAEKPAHLVLGSYIHLVDYVGGRAEDDDEFADRPVLHKDEDPSIPSTPAEKKKYPRLFAGVGLAANGSAAITPAVPTNDLVRARAGVAQFVHGEAKIEPARPTNDLIRLKAGVGFSVGGEITIGCDYELPPYHIRENPTALLAPSSFAIARGALYFEPPPDELESLPFDTVKIFFNFPISRHRRVRGVALPNARQDLTREEIQQTGQYAVDNKIITNAAGELASSVTKAALKTRESIRVF